MDEFGEENEILRQYYTHAVYLIKWVNETDRVSTTYKLMLQ